MFSESQLTNFDELAKISTVPGVYVLGLRESDRQMVLLALATLAVERPGFQDALESIALRIDNEIVDRSNGRVRRVPQIFTNLRRIRKGESLLPTESNPLRRIR